MWQVEKISYPKHRTLFQIQLFYSFFSRFWSKHVFKSSWKFINSSLLNSSIFNKPYLSDLYSTKYQYNAFKKTDFHGNTVLNPERSLKLFPVYTTLLTQTTLLTSQVHPSHKFNFISNKDLNISTFNLTKLKQKWVDMYHLFYNLFFYQVPVLSFTTPLFKTELLSLNWKLTKKLHTYWKYISPSFYSSRNKVMKAEFLLFNYLSKQGYHLAFVFDVLYHKNTLFYLHRNNFFTFGLIPLHTSLYTVSFALPISSDSVFLHLFFIRLLIHIQKQASNRHFTNMSNLWLRS